MFNKLKEKIKNWTKKFSEKAEEREEEKEAVEEISIPTRFNAGTQKYEPDLEKLKKKAEKIEREIHLEPSLDQQLRGETIGKDLKEEPKPGGEGFFKKVTSKISKVKISEKDFEPYAEELEMLLLENNVALEVVEKMIQELKERIVGKEILRKEIEEEIKEAFKVIIEDILIEPFSLVEKIKEKLQDQAKEPYVILFCGINGSGKTTSIAKIADFLKKEGVSCVMAASDTFRAASIEQLEEHGKKIGIKIISNGYGVDPASVAYDAVKYAKKNFIDCVLIDTAGRMHTSKNLLKEIEKISRVAKPDLKIFVGESITGNDAIEQARSFDWSIGIDGIVLTKADIDDKGGTSLSISYVTKKPILYLGTGQAYDAIEPFDKKKFIKRLGL